jgi:hypothetical protein
MPTNPSSKDAIIERILRLSATDADFRALLLTDPHAAAKQVTPNGIPSRVHLKFIEKPSGVDALYVLPTFASYGSLPDEELEAIAGGVDDCTEWDETCGHTTCGSTCPIETCYVTCPTTDGVE